MVGELTADGSGTFPPWFVMQRYDIRGHRLWDGMAGGGQRWENKTKHPTSRRERRGDIEICAKDSYYL